MTPVYLVSFPMSRRKDADAFVRDVLGKGKNFHVSENGIDGTVDVFVVCPCTTLTKIAAKYGLTPTKYTE